MANIHSSTSVKDVSDDQAIKANVEEEFKMQGPILSPLPKTESYPFLELASDALKGFTFMSITDIVA